MRASLCRSYSIGAEFSASVVTSVFYGFMGARLLSSSWIQVAISTVVVAVHHSVLIIDGLSRGPASRPSRLDGISAYGAPGSRAFEATFLCLAFLRALVLAVATSRLEDWEAREDYILDARTRHRRNVSQRVVESMVPGPIANEMRLRMAQGLPPSLSWKFDMICILQSDIVGFTRRVHENRT